MPRTRRLVNGEEKAAYHIMSRTALGVIRDAHKIITFYIDSRFLRRLFCPEKTLGSVIGVGLAKRAQSSRHSQEKLKALGSKLKAQRMLVGPD